MSTIQQTIKNQASTFAAALVSALRQASISELIAIAGSGGSFRTSASRPSRGADKKKSGRVAHEKKGRRIAHEKKGGRMARRAPGDIERTLARIVAAVAEHPNGLRVQQIKSALHLEQKEIARPLAKGLKSGALTKTGQKRATTYFAGSGEVTMVK